jgi:hypothetical protein
MANPTNQATGLGTTDRQIFLPFRRLQSPVRFVVREIGLNVWAIVDRRVCSRVRARGPYTRMVFFMGVLNKSETEYGHLPIETLVDMASLKGLVRQYPHNPLKALEGSGDG